MIHIIDEYYVDGGVRDFTLLKKSAKLNKKSNPIYRPIGYYCRVSDAVESVRKIKCRELTHNKNMELCEAVTAFKQIAEELERVTEGLK